MQWILKSGEWYATGHTTGLTFVSGVRSQRAAMRWDSRWEAECARKMLVHAGARAMGHAPEELRLVRLVKRGKR